MMLLLATGYALRYSGKIGGVGDINAVLGRIIMPALYGQAIANLDINTTPWKFIGSLVAGKLLLFVIVAAAVFTIQKGDRSTKFQRAGLYAVFVTQSNDVAFGVPVRPSPSVSRGNQGLFRCTITSIRVSRRMCCYSTACR